MPEAVARLSKSKINQSRHKTNFIATLLTIGVKPFINMEKMCWFRKTTVYKHSAVDFYGRKWARAAENGRKYPMADL